MEESFHFERFWKENLRVVEKTVSSFSLMKTYLDNQKMSEWDQKILFSIFCSFYLEEETHYFSLYQKSTVAAAAQNVNPGLREKLINYFDAYCAGLDDPLIDSVSFYYLWEYKLPPFFAETIGTIFHAINETNFSFLQEVLIFPTIDDLVVLSQCSDFLLNQKLSTNEYSSMDGSKFFQEKQRFIATLKPSFFTALYLAGCLDVLATVAVKIHDSFLNSKAMTYCISEISKWRPDFPDPLLCSLLLPPVLGGNGGTFQFEQDRCKLMYLVSSSL